MRKTFHLSLSSHNEVMFRNEADLIRGFNCLALAMLETDSRLLADGFISTHLHNLTQTDAPVEVMRRYRLAYTRYFNARHKRSGRMAEKYCFKLPVEGFHHTMAALNYVNRQGLHHGLAPTPFGYPYCSARAFFSKQLGMDRPVALMPDSKRYRYLPHGNAVPSSYRMDASGLLFREDILDVALVESYYVTPRNYLYQMNRIGDEMLLKEQRGEESSSPLITLDLIEQGTPDRDIARLLQNEKGKFNPAWISDLELCALIDETCLPKYCKGVTIYETTLSQRRFLYDLIWRNLWQVRHKRTYEAQLRRCLCL